MVTKTMTRPVSAGHAEPAWDVARLWPSQGAWSEEDYLWLTDHTRYLVEFTAGRVEVLPMPTEEHQRIVLALYRALYAYLAARGTGIVLVAPLRVRLRAGRYREPDLLVLLSADDARRGNRFWTGADLVVEVVSPDDPRRDLVRKRREYARTGIAEYWIVNPITEQIHVLRLQGKAYVTHGTFARGAMATSALLTDYTVEVSVILDAV